MPDVAEERALQAGLSLSPDHWQVLTVAREECLRTHRFPDACRIAETAGIPRAELERLFPGRTCDVIAHLAGLPPKGCRAGSSCNDAFQETGCVLNQSVPAPPCPRSRGRSRVDRKSST